MEQAIADFLSKNPYGVIFAFIITLIGTILGLIGCLRKTKKQISYSLETTHILKKGFPKVNDLRVEYKDKNIEQLSITRIRIWNSGNVLIEKDDLYKNQKITIDSVGAVEILSCTIENQSTVTIEAKLEDNILNFETIEVHDGVYIDVFHTGDSNKDIILSGKIKGGKLMSNTLSDEKKAEILNATMEATFLSVPFDIWRLFKKLR